MHGWTDGLIMDAIVVSTDRVDKATNGVAIYVGQCSLLVLAANSASRPGIADGAAGSSTRISGCARWGRPWLRGEVRGVGARYLAHERPQCHAAG